MYFSFNDEGRVMISSSKPIFTGMVELDPPEGFDGEHQPDWIYNGAWVHDPLPAPDDNEAQQPTPEERMERLEEENAQLKEAIELLLSGEVGADG